MISRYDGCAAFKWSARLIELQSVIRTLDAANARLESTMKILRSTMVEAAFRPDKEEPRSLLDFVDEQGVETMRDALKQSIRESNVSPPSSPSLQI